MIWAQIIWGAILAGLLAFSFCRAWKWEHGDGPRTAFAEKNGKETFILTSPTTMFLVLIAFLIIFVYFFGVQDGLTRFAALAADVMLFLSAYFILLLILLPFLRRWFSARACAVLWVVPAFLFWQAAMLLRTIPLPRKTIYVPRSALPVIGLVWLAGFLAVGGYYLISHLVFSAWVRKNTTEEPDEEICAVWERTREELDYLRPVRLLRGNVSAPFSMGKTKRSRCTVLPDRHYTPKELSMIFSHELHHLQRCDVDTKVFLCLCRALCWFDPLVWIAAKKAAEDLERSCDEIVTEDMDESERRAYAQLLLDAAAPGQGCTTCLSAAAGTLRYRLKGVMDQRRRRLGTVVLMAAVFICVMCFGMVSFSDERGSFTSLFLDPDTEISAIYDDQYEKTIYWDDEALRDVLDEIELEHIAGLRMPAADSDSVSPLKEKITFLLSDGRYVTLYDRVLIVRDYKHYSSAGDCYMIKNSVNWSALLDSLK